MALKRVVTVLERKSRLWYFIMPVIVAWERLDLGQIFWDYLDILKKTENK